MVYGLTCSLTLSTKAVLVKGKHLNRPLFISALLQPMANPHAGCLCGAVNNKSTIVSSTTALQVPPPHILWKFRGDRPFVVMSKMASSTALQVPPPHVLFSWNLRPETVRLFLMSTHGTISAHPESLTRCALNSLHHPHHQVTAARRKNQRLRREGGLPTRRARGGTCWRWSGGGA